MISRGHPLVRRLRALRRDAALRREEGVLVAEGIHLAEEALRAGVAIETALVAPRLHEAGLRQALRQRAERFAEAPDDLLDALQDARSPQPVLLVIREPNLPTRAGVPLVVVAAGLQDPGNLGTLVRSADAAGATELLACDGVDLHHPRAVRGSQGGIFRLRCTRAPLLEALAALEARGILRVGAASAGGQDYAAFDWRRPLAIVLGGEGAGLGALPPASLDARVSVPMHDGVESLSVAAAGAVLLFEAARKRRVTRVG